MRLLVYTCVFGGYDRVFPPVLVEPTVDYVIVTDNADMHVPGWRTKLVEFADSSNPKTENRRIKMLGHRMLGEYDASVYLDGNVRVLGPLSPLLNEFLETNSALGVYPHPRRDSVAEEIQACVIAGKVTDSTKAMRELSEYVADGFPDRNGLVEATILLKNHAHPDLDLAMGLWFGLFNKFHSRDQFSLPYVLWKTGLTYKLQPASFREPNPYFGIYPHISARGVPFLYTYLSARAYDSRFHYILQKLWHAKWTLQRLLRRGKFEPS